MHIVLCDDHTLVVEGFTLLLQALQPGLRVSCHARAETLLGEAPRWTDVTLVLLDLALPDSEGLQALTRLRQLREDVPVVVLSGVDQRERMLQCIEAGAMGFIPKSVDSRTLEAALQHVLSGGIYLPAGAPATAARAPGVQLTPRQWEILAAVLQGKSIKRIALDLDISIATTKTHVSAVLRALNVTNRTEAIVKAAQLGLKLHAPLPL